IYFKGSAAPLLSLLTARIANQDLAHRSRRNSEKVRAVLPAWIGLIGQAQVSFVNQRRRLQRVARPLPTQMMMRNPPQLAINQRSQFRESSLVAVTPLHQKIGHSLLGDRWHVHNFFSQATKRKEFLHVESAPKSWQFR